VFSSSAWIPVPLDSTCRAHSCCWILATCSHDCHDGAPRTLRSFAAGAAVYVDVRIGSSSSSVHSLHKQMQTVLQSIRRREPILTSSRVTDVVFHPQERVGQMRTSWDVGAAIKDGGGGRSDAIAKTLRNSGPTARWPGCLQFTGSDMSMPRRLRLTSHRLAHSVESNQTFRR
jgi:hypothetical protein